MKGFYRDWAEGKTLLRTTSHSQWNVICECMIIMIIPWLKKIIWVMGVLGGTVVGDWRFGGLCGGRLQSRVVVLVSWGFGGPGERFDWSVDGVAVGGYVVWLAVRTCAEMGCANGWIVEWVMNGVLLFPVEWTFVGCGRRLTAIWGSLF